MPQLATICYIDNGKELLMLHRNKKPNDVHEGKWIGVGGKLERGETPQECAAREIFGILPRVRVNSPLGSRKR